MRVVVTGAAGFIGSHVVNMLVHQGAEVLALDDLSEGCLENLAAACSAITFRRLDIRNRAACREEFLAWRPEGVVHLAAVASVPRSIQEPEYAHDVNINGTFNVLEATRVCAARRYVFASSAAVYGPNPSLPSDELQVARPVSPYAAQKLAGEFMAHAYRSSWDVEAVALRFFNVFGERQRADNPYSGVISVFSRALLATGRATITGDGEQTRDFIYVGDVARAVVRALCGCDPGPGPINIGRGESVSIRSLYRILARECGVPDRPSFGPPRAGDVRHSRAKIDRMLATLEVRPEVSMQEGLSRLLAAGP
jgi:UDP-glucose 4-epimerase